MYWVLLTDPFWKPSKGVTKDLLSDFKGNQGNLIKIKKNWKHSLIEFL